MFCFPAHGIFRFWFLQFFTCVFWGILLSTNLVDRVHYSFTPLRFFSLFFYISLFWNLESILIYSFCSFLCSFLLSILSILLFFSTLLSAPCSVFSLSIYSLYFLNPLIVFFSNLLSFIFLSLFLLLYSVCFSLMFYYYSICSLSVRALHSYLFCSCFCFLYTPFFW